MEGGNTHMSNTIDQKVVQMQFDNKQFETNVRGSMSTIEKLKQSLLFRGATQGFEAINTASQKIDMSGLISGVESVKMKFSALQIFAVTALANISNAVFNTGKNMMSALTIDPIKTGFSEYETKINSIQTILSNTSSKGTTMSDVTAVIDDLNTYADKTIYNFAEMTRNIGTFTAAGVALKTSASDIKGIANLAASSGSTSLQASTAMYQLSQAVAAGTVKLMDWNSVVNAGMGGEKFQEALKATAREHGVAVDEMIAEEGSFRDSLQKGWITADILNETLNNFTVDGATNYAKSMMETGKWTQEQADALIKEATAMEDAATKVKTFTQLWDTLKEAAQSGWGKTWEIIVGDFEEAKDLFTQVSDTLGAMIGSSADARNNLLQTWKDLGGRAQIIDVIRNAFEGLTIVVNTISDAFRTIFPRITTDQLLGFTAGLQELSKKFKMSDENALKLKNVFLGLFDILQFGIQLFQILLGVVSPVGGVMSKIAQKVLDAASVFGVWLTTIDEAFFGLKSVGDYSNTFKQNITSAFKSLPKVIKSSGLLENLKTIGSGLQTIGKYFAANLTKIFSAIEKVLNGIDFDAVLNNLSSGLKTLASAFKISDSNVQKLKTAFDGLFALIEMAIKLFPTFVRVLEPVVAILAGIGKILFTIAGGLAQFLLDIAATIGAWLIKMNDGEAEMTNIGDSAEAMSATIKKAFDEASDNIANSKFFKILNGIGDFLIKVGGVIGTVFGGLVDVIVQGFSNIDFDTLVGGLGVGGMGAIVYGIIKFIKNLSGPFESFKLIAEAVVGVLDQARDALKAYQDQLKAKILMNIAIAVGILAASLFILSTIDGASLARALGGMTVMFGELIGALTLFQKINPLSKGALISVGVMIALSVSILILATAMKVLSSMDWGEIARGITAVTVLMAELVIAMKILSSEEGTIVKGAGSMILFAVAIKILASAVADLAELSWEQLAKGLVGVGILLTGIALFCNNTKFSGNMVAVGIGIVLVATAMKILASAVADFGNMSWDQLGQGLIGLALALGILTVALNAMPKNMLLIGAGLAIAAIGIRILASAIEALGGLTWEEAGRGLLTMGLALGILAIGLEAMTATLPGSAALLVAAVAIGILTPALMLLSTLSWEGIIKSLLVLAGTFLVFGAAAAILTPLLPSMLLLAAAVLALGVGVGALGAGLFLAGLGIQALAVGLGMLAGITASSAIAIVNAITTIVTGIVTLIPTVATELAKGLVAFAQVLIDGAPTIAAAVIAIGAAILAVVGELIPQVVTVFFQLLVAIVGAFAQYIPIIAQSVLDLIVGILETIAQNIPRVIQAGVDIITAFVIGIGEAIPQVIDAGFKAIIAFINGLAEAIRSNTQPLIDAANNLFGAIIDAGIAIFNNAIGGFMDAGNAIMNNGFIKGVLDTVGGIGEAIFGGIKSAIDGIAGFVKDFIKVGGDIINGFIEGITGGKDDVATAADDVANTALDSSKEALDSNSPSKKYEQLGLDSDKGLANGLYKGIGLVATAATKAGEGALDSTSSVLAGLADNLLGSIDAQPTIKPVVDLTNIQNGAASINGLFGNQSVSLAASAQVTQVPKSSLSDMINTAISATIKNLSDAKKDSDSAKDSKTVIEVPVYLDGKTIAKVTAPLINDLLGPMNNLSERSMA